MPDGHDLGKHSTAIHPWHAYVTMRLLLYDSHFEYEQCWMCGRQSLQRLADPRQMQMHAGCTPTDESQCRFVAHVHALW